MISDAGFQGEITSVSTACHQIEVFSRVLKTSVAAFLEGGEESLEKHLPEFTVRVCQLYVSPLFLLLKTRGTYNSLFKVKGMIKL